MEEIWKDIDGYEGRYMVSNLGNVKSMNFRGHGYSKVMNPATHHSGYKIVAFGIKPKKSYFVHTLVANAFVPNPSKKPYVNHIDGDKLNNASSNLEWVTAKENSVHAVRTGLKDPNNAHRAFDGENSSSKPVYQFDKDGNFIKKWNSRSEAARSIGCSMSSIGNKVDKPGMTTFGFVWLSSPGKFDEWKSGRIENGKYRWYTPNKKTPEHCSTVLAWIRDWEEQEPNESYVIAFYDSSIRKGKSSDWFVGFRLGVYMEVDNSKIVAWTYLPNPPKR